ncbi:decapping and exoribonuclease protein-like [Daphnia pulex]|uniref:decapping and exoribonuclease protein-like n=1 Tax=Daphnia pulex TaxID=6669 RepID=UPI001EDF0B7D|nr:decapping and exoribonuclease protein-like [Daphnia pulex]
MNRQHQSRNTEKDFAPNPRHLRNERERESDTTLSVQHQNFNGNFPTFEMPKAVGTFSLDIHRKYHSDFSELRYLTFDIPESGSCKVKFDLRKGISDAIDKDQESIKQKMLDDMLTWILQERKADNGLIVDLQQPLRPLLTEFVCFRGLLTALIFTPYENQEGWKILATKFQNTIYLWQIKEQRENGNNFSRNPRNAKRMQEMTMWGFKFEQYLCSATPDSIPDSRQPLNTNAEFCCVLKTKLAGKSLLYGAEVDALQKECQPPFRNLENFVELKTNRHIETERQNDSFLKFKSMKWWAQSFIVGIPKIVVGYRDDDGVVSRLKTIEVKQLPKESQGFWEAKVGMNFCQGFLEFARNCISNDSDSNIQYLFEFNPRKRTISFCREAGEACRNLLPSWYLESMQEPV